jgi:hypothetical protein
VDERVGQPVGTGVVRACGAAVGIRSDGTDERQPRHNRFSLPTKLISYLANGLPVIALDIRP